MTDYFTSRRTLIEDTLARLSARIPAPPPLLEPLRYSMANPGKRVRGILVMAAADSAGAKGEQLADAAAAMEMIHTSSLILDDLPAMDDAEMRRGRPALHRAYGEDVAILTAVALLNHGYGLISENHAALRPRRWPANVVIGRIVDAVGWDGSIAGEAVDLHSEGSTLDFDTLEFIHSRKTGALFVASAVVGAMLANAARATIERLSVFAKNLGLAFQITDDILDVTASADEVGKDVGKDTGHLTFVKLAGIDGARKLGEELIDTSIRSIEPLGKAAQPLRDLALALKNRTR